MHSGRVLGCKLKTAYEYEMERYNNKDNQKRPNTTRPIARIIWGGSLQESTSALFKPQPLQNPNFCPILWLKVDLLANWGVCCTPTPRGRSRYGPIWSYPLSLVTAKSCKFSLFWGYISASNSYTLSPLFANPGSGPAHTHLATGLNTTT